MARVKRAVNAHKKRRVVLERASGYRGQRSRLYRKAKEQVTHSLVYAYRDRKKRKGDFRQLWIQRINAAARPNGMTYNRFIQGLKAAGVEVDRKVLADLAVNDAAAFAALVEVAKARPAGRRQRSRSPTARTRPPPDRRVSTRRRPARPDAACAPRTRAHQHPVRAGAGGSAAGQARLPGPGAAGSSPRGRRPSARRWPRPAPSPSCSSPATPPTATPSSLARPPSAPACRSTWSAAR